MIFFFFFYNGADTNADSLSLSVGRFFGLLVVSTSGHRRDSTNDWLSLRPLAWPVHQTPTFPFFFSLFPRSADFSELRSSPVFIVLAKQNILGVNLQKSGTLRRSYVAQPGLVFCFFCFLFFCSLIFIFPRLTGRPTCSCLVCLQVNRKWCLEGEVPDSDVKSRCV